MKTDLPTAIRLADYAPSSFLVRHVDLHLRLDGDQSKAQARYEVVRNPTSNAGSQANTLVLHADNNQSVDVKVDGADVTAEQTASTVEVPLEGEGPWAVEIEAGLDPAANTALSGLYLTNSVYCTQCEAEGFRRIIPALDRPDVMATYTVTMDAKRADCPILLSNGNPGEQTDLGDGWHRAVWHDPHPKPSYLFAAVGGQLDCLADSFQTEGGRDVALKIYVEPGKSSRATFAMQALKRAMRWDEVRFGRQYDLDVFQIVAVSDFNLGAMENKGLNIFNDKYILASPQTATDEDYRRIDAIIAHEYFHNWSGNRVTCRDWFQLCLKEGLTVYRDQEYTSDTYDRTIKRIEDVRDLWVHQFPEDGGPLAHPVRPDSYREINNFYTPTVYEKGAEIVRMVANWIGRDRFRTAMDDYFQRFDGQAATLEDFLACMRAQAPEKAGWPDFLTWYTQAGTPQLTISWSREDGANEAKLSLSQMTPATPGQSKKRALAIPVKMGLVDETGQDIDLANHVRAVQGGSLVGDQFLLEAEDASLELQDLPNQAIRPSLLRNFSAPVALIVHGFDEADRLFLATHDPNAYNRWAHVQALASDALQRRYHRLGLGEPVGDDSGLLRALVAPALDSACEQATDDATKAAVLTLPTVHDLARTLAKNVDADRAQSSRHGLSQALAAAHGKELLETLEELGPSDEDDLSPLAAAKRVLITAILGHLAFAQDAALSDIVLKAHKRSTGMTMRIKTLGMLVKHALPGAGDALAAYAHDYADIPLAMDKWFVVQAMAGGAEDIERLEQHPAYDRTNPNRVRSLVGAFATGNLAGFHAADGTGYRLLGDRVIELDGVNPQLAARLASAFRSWRTMSPGRAALAEGVLQDMASQSNLSRDVADMVARMLKG